jgi:hypothetical protein
VAAGERGLERRRSSTSASRAASRGPSDNFGDNYMVPAGVLGQFSINKQLAVGTSWVFGEITGASV